MPPKKIIQIEENLRLDEQRKQKVLPSQPTPGR
jgi:hypothetical protein